MIRRLAGGLVALFTWFCVGTVLAIAIGSGYLWSQGHLTRDALVQMAALAQGVDLPAMRAAAELERRQQHSQQVSLDEIALRRALAARDLELREQSLARLSDMLRHEQSKLGDEVSRYMNLYQELMSRLDAMREQAAAASQANARLILENVRPIQAKDQLMRMVADGKLDVAALLLTQMPVKTQAKVVGEFRTDQEAAALAEMLKRIRDGVPEVTLIDETRDKLQQVRPPGS